LGVLRGWCHRALTPWAPLFRMRWLSAGLGRSAPRGRSLRDRERQGHTARRAARPSAPTIRKNGRERLVATRATARQGPRKGYVRSTQRGATACARGRGYARPGQRRGMLQIRRAGCRPGCHRHHGEGGEPKVRTGRGRDGRGAPPQPVRWPWRPPRRPGASGNPNRRRQARRKRCTHRAARRTGRTPISTTIPRLIGTPPCPLASDGTWRAVGSIGSCDPEYHTPAADVNLNEPNRCQWIGAPVRVKREGQSIETRAPHLKALQSGDPGARVRQALDPANWPRGETSPGDIPEGSFRH